MQAAQKIKDQCFPRFKKSSTKISEKRLPRFGEAYLPTTRCDFSFWERPRVLWLLKFLMQEKANKLLSRLQGYLSVFAEWTSLHHWLLTFWTQNCVVRRKTDSGNWNKSVGGLAIWRCMRGKDSNNRQGNLRTRPCSLCASTIIQVTILIMKT